jgi:alkylated DNA repair dioxygenase AlkB
LTYTAIVQPACLCRTVDALDESAGDGSRSLPSPEGTSGPDYLAHARDGEPRRGLGTEDAANPTAVQFSLLPEPDVRVLVDDQTGRIVYRRGLFDAVSTQRWFEQLRSGVAWRTERRPMYDRIVEVPRLIASFSLDDSGLPAAIAEMRPAVEHACGMRFTSAGLNFYRDGNDSVAPHGDHVERGPRGAPVALVSLGATRRMTIRSKARPRRVLDLDLEPGSLLIMSYESHFHYLHAIPKTRGRVGPRISVTFRQTRL